MPTEQGSTFTQLPPDVQQQLSAAGGAPVADLITAFVATILRSRDLERGDLKVMHRAVRELRRGHRRGRRGDSDADMLAGLTRVPAGMWTALFWLLAGVAVITAAWVLLR